MAAQSRRTLAIAILLIAAGTPTAACGGDASGCSDFNPESDPLPVGASAAVEVEIANGGWATPDIAGNYWDTDATVPTGAPTNGVVIGIAARVHSDTVRVDLGPEYGTVDFTGPIGCM